MQAKRKLPQKGSREERLLIKKYPSASAEDIRGWADKYGFSSVKNFQTCALKTLGLRRKHKSLQNKEKIEVGDLVVNLPPVNILKADVEVESRYGNEEIIGVIACDGHAGKITRTFNKTIYRNRMETMFESIIKIATLHRHMYPIKKITIFNVGDNVQGENPFQGSKVGDIEMGARDQVKHIAIPRWNDFLGSLSSHFDSVDVHCIAGNHGREKLAPETSSYDLLFYDILQAGIGRYDGVKIHVYDSFSQIVNVMGFKFFMFHGDGIPCQYGVPFFALDKKLVKWYMQYGGFNYAVGGHFHKRHFDEVSSRLEYLMSSTLVSDDDWALKKLGISSNPSQVIFGINPKKGVTWRYPLVVDHNFFPEKI